MPDSEVQTELHVEPSNIVPGYSWNEWDYRRRALLLAKVSRSATRSTQTHVQYTQVTQGAQASGLTNSYTNTNRSVYTEAPRSQAFFYGLRGYHCSTHGSYPPHIVELTREPLLEMKVIHSTSQDTNAKGEKEAVKGSTNCPPPPPPPQDVQVQVDEPIQEESFLVKVKASNAPAESRKE